MSSDLIINIILCVLILLLTFAYLIYIINIDNKKKIKYYQKVINYDTDWDKYDTMVKKQKKIIIGKKIKLLLLIVIVKIKRFLWK